VLKCCGIAFSEGEKTALGAAIKEASSGLVNFEKFLCGVRGQPNERRQSIIDKVFLNWDSNVHGKICSKDLKYTYPNNP
jgi:hypothetical protein